MSELIADTEYGKVRGIKKISALNNAYNAFLGIRYATPPLGNLRFKVSELTFKADGFVDFYR
jgi:cholinesterase